MPDPVCQTTREELSIKLPDCDPSRSICHCMGLGRFKQPQFTMDLRCRQFDLRKRVNDFDRHQLVPYREVATASLSLRPPQSSGIDLNGSEAIRFETG